MMRGAIRQTKAAAAAAVGPLPAAPEEDKAKDGK